MITCFIHPKFHSSSGYSFEQFIHTVFLIVFTLIPCINFFYGLAEAIIIFNTIRNQNDQEGRALFKKYVVYIGSYLLLTFFMFLLYFWAVFDSSEGSSPLFRWTSYFITLMLVSTPLIVGVVRFIEMSSKSGLLKKCFGKSAEPLGSLMTENMFEFDSFEKKAIKKFVSNIYVSVCYCLANVQQYSEIKINSESSQETNEYQIDKEKVLSLSDSRLANDSVVLTSDNFSITCVEFAPKIFSYLRKIDEISENEIIQSFLPMNNTQGIKESEGKSGNFFINTDDKQFILKTIVFEDVELIRTMLIEKMANHFTVHNDSIIGRIYGLYKLKIKTGLFSEDEIYFILMKNVFGIFQENVLCKYDLKGSALNRKVELDGDKIDQEVMKDLNFLEIEGGLMLNEQTTKKLMTVSANDVTFLASLGIMDYSLLVVKLSLNKDEIIEVFGRFHRKKAEREITFILGEKEMSSFSMEDSEDDKDNSILNNDNMRFDSSQIGNLKKYIFPSLKPDVAYIIAIIDFFQLYNLRKNLETKFKLIKAKKTDISSVPPEEYVIRFINNMSKITNGRQLLQHNQSSEEEKKNTSDNQ